jgi:spore germination cell wall hydrolase CwlJ-like protein
MTPPTQQAKATATDIDVLARTLWGEARGESLEGMKAVAWTIRNRVNDGRSNSWWGEGYAGVCQKPYQFSCWNANDPNSPYLKGARPIPAGEYKKALQVATAVVNDVGPDPTSGATHYYATTMPKAPAWVAGATQTLRLGHHIFFKGVA